MFTRLMSPRVDAVSDFKYPAESLFKLQSILSEQGIRTPVDRDRNNDPVHYVIKRGINTLTTIGRLNSFQSFRRKYFDNVTLDSVEAAILPDDSKAGPFSKGGDSGSIIVDARGNFVALLTGGTGDPGGSVDITYGTPMHWLWEVIKTRFEGADLHFDNLG